MIETIITSMVGQELFSHALTNTTNSIYSEVAYLTGYSIYNFKEIIENLDIIAKIEIISILIKEYEQSSIFIDGSRKKCLESLVVIIEKINHEMLAIRDAINEHEKKWLHKWRGNVYEPMIKSLVSHVKIMENRLELFTKVNSISQ